MREAAVGVGGRSKGRPQRLLALILNHMWNTPNSEQLARIPRLGSQLENPDLETGDIMMHLHFYVGSCDWWIAEFDGEDTFYGFACLGDSSSAEWGTVSFSELRKLMVNVPMKDEQSGESWQIPVEIDTDLSWTPRRFGDIERVQQILGTQRGECCTASVAS